MKHASIVLKSQTEISLSDIKSLIGYYREITEKTGQQLGWEYGSSAFPYHISEQNDKLMVLESSERGFHQIFIGLANGEPAVIQFYLPENSAHGDKAKANELCKFFARKLGAELHLFSGKVMRFG
ncbi:DUF1885 family protein [Metabacillus sp. 84]|uniref:DUF1885 family protein n=1 Tax=unclassified Metabacillus TaxID=2675274 RepID=UPI003CEC3287